MPTHDEIHYDQDRGAGYQEVTNPAHPRAVPGHKMNNSKNAGEREGRHEPT
jgi:hypothetical protein